MENPKYTLKAVSSNVVSASLSTSSAVRARAFIESHIINENADRISVTLSGRPRNTIEIPTLVSLLPKTPNSIISPDGTVTSEVSQGSQTVGANVRHAIDYVRELSPLLAGAHVHDPFGGHGTSTNILALAGDLAPKKITRSDVLYGKPRADDERNQFLPDVNLHNLLDAFQKLPRNLRPRALKPVDFNDDARSLLNAKRKRIKANLIFGIPPFGMASTNLGFTGDSSLQIMLDHLEVFHTVLHPLGTAVYVIPKHWLANKDWVEMEGKLRGRGYHTLQWDAVSSSSTSRTTMYALSKDAESIDALKQNRARLKREHSGS